MKQEPYRIPTWGITVKPSGIGDPFADPDENDTRREDEPGPWFIAGYDDECSRGGESISEGDTIRADGDGGWECRDCVDEDEDKAEDWEIYAESTGMREAAS